MGNFHICSWYSICLGTRILKHKLLFFCFPLLEKNKFRLFFQKNVLDKNFWKFLTLLLLWVLQLKNTKFAANSSGNTAENFENFLRVLWWKITSEPSHMSPDTFIPADSDFYQWTLVRFEYQPPPSSPITTLLTPALDATLIYAASRSPSQNTHHLHFCD